MTKRTATGMSGLLALMLWCGGSVAAAAQHPFGPGERLDFDVSYLGLGSGRCALRIDPPREAAGPWPIVFEGGARGPFGLFMVRQEARSLWDPEEEKVLEVHAMSESGGKSSQSIARFDEPGKKFDVTRLRDGKQSTLTVAAGAGSQDLASMVFYLRTQRLSVGDRIEFPVFTGKRMATLEARVVKREQVKTSAGVFDTVRVEGVLSAESRRELTFWFTDDARHLPVKFEASMNIGAMKASLRNYTP